MNTVGLTKKQNLKVSIVVWIILVVVFGLVPQGMAISDNAHGASEYLYNNENAPLSLSGSQINQNQIMEKYLNIPLYFEINEGQTDSSVQFISRGPGYNLFLTPAEVILSLSKFQKPSREIIGLSQEFPSSSRNILRMGFVGSNPHPQITGLEQTPAKVNYFIGEDSKQWHTNVSTYGKVRYKDLYPGIDAVFYGNQGQLEYDFVLSPGAHPQDITLAFNDVGKLSKDEQGNLVIGLNGSEVIQKAPVIYQEIDGKRQNISGQYEIQGKNQVTFEVAAYDASKPLIIDPVLIYSSFLGGGDFDEGVAIAVDTSGNAYLTGSTASINFPLMSPISGANGGSLDVFITKVNSDGSALVYSTYLGGPNAERGGGITVDALGNAYVTGRATSGVGFPTTAGAYQTTPGGSVDGFVVKVNPAGSSVIYSTLLGGNGFDDLRDIAVDAVGSAYVVGQTSSPFATFPTPPPAGGFDQILNGFDALVVKVSPDGTALQYFTYLGGTGGESGDGISIDGAGNAFITGATTSTAATFPETPGVFQVNLAGAADAFVAKFNPGGSALIYCTYLGGTNSDQGHDIGIDSSGNAYVTGTTTSNNFPTAVPLQLTYGGGLRDAFVTKLNSSATAPLTYSTYLGGNAEDDGFGMAVDSMGNAHIMGTTNSPNFPTSNFLMPGGDTLSGPSDAFVSKINSGGSAFIYSTYLGGGGDEFGLGVTVDSAGDAYVIGSTTSADFPTQSAFQPVAAGNQDVFVSKLGEVPPLTVSPDNVTVGVGSNADSTVSGGMQPYMASSGDGGIATASVSGDTVTITGTGPGATMVTVTDNLGSNVTIDVTVTAVLPPLNVSNDNVTVATGDSMDVTLSGGQTPYTASSDDPGIATASIAGSTLSITGVSIGSTMVTVMDDDGNVVNIGVSVSENVPPTVGGCDAGANVSATFDTNAVNEVNLLLCRQTPIAFDGRLYVSLEAPGVFPGFLFFRPGDDRVPLPNGSYIQLVRDNNGFLPDAADAYYFEGLLTPIAGDLSFAVGTSGLDGLTLVFSTFSLTSGMEINEVNLQLIQVVRITFN